MTNSLDGLKDGDAYDVVVIGAGGAGMSAALFAAIDGAKVLLVERTEHVGGTTALSAGTSWVPTTAVGAKVDANDSVEIARGFLERAVGTRGDEALRLAFLNNGAKAVALLEANSEVKYQCRQFHPDYLSELDGSRLRGRAIEPVPFDGRKLGDALALVRPPIPEFTVLGGMMVDRDDISHLLGITKKWASFKYGVRIITRHLMDRMRYGRGTRLVMGNALIARLLYSLIRRDATILTSTRLVALQQNENDGRVSGVVLSQGDIKRTLRVNGGVVLASGGFNRNPQRRAEMMPGMSIDWCPGAPGHTGEAQDIALSVGARFGENSLSPAFWAPVSIRKRVDGSTAVFPHFIMDRGKPGMITVNQSGQRFLNESTSYHLFALAMQDAHRASPCIPAYLICDAAALRRYGLGMIRPGANAGSKALRPFLDDGYLTKGESLLDLATKLGIAPDALATTVARFNVDAAAGVDTAFDRGATDYQRANGDATFGSANPCLGPLSEAPFFALRLYPGDIGAAVGLKTDADARVLDQHDRPIGSLYACGNDMHSIMGGTYPAPGITLGPGLAFAYIAARHALVRARAAA
jgi:succinate dehydrogenase/fumarate reductase flavoprotein subunit